MALDETMKTILIYVWLSKYRNNLRSGLPKKMGKSKDRLHRRTGRGARGAAALPNFGQLRFFGQHEKFGQSQFLKTSASFYYYF